MTEGDEERAKTAATSTSTNKRVESLGWLTESAVMPKKHKAIEGVGASSIVELKAQLYRTQEQARIEKAHLQASEEFHRAKKKVLPTDPVSVKNSGVESRARKKTIRDSVMDIRGTCPIVVIIENDEIIEGTKLSVLNFGLEFQ